MIKYILLLLSFDPTLPGVTVFNQMLYDDVTDCLIAAEEIMPRELPNHDAICFKITFDTKK